MDPAKRTKDKLYKRHLKKRQKEYLRLERQTVRKQQKELRRLKNRYRFRLIQRYFGSLRNGIVGKTDPDVQRESPGKRRPPGPPRGRRRKDVLQDRKKASQERKKAKANAKMLRKKIRAARIQQWKTNVHTFLANPFRRRRTKASEKILKRQIRQDIRDQRRKRFREFPSNISNTVKLFFETRKRRFRHRIKSFSEVFSPITRRVHSERLLPELVVNMLNSAALFVIAFWIVFYLLNLSSLLAAQRYSIPAILYSFKVDWPLYTYSVMYTRRSLVVIFGIGPLFLLVSSLLLYRWKKRLAKRPGFGTLLITWLLFHSISLVFGGVIAGLVTRTGLARTIEWLFLTRPFNPLELGFLVTSIFVMILAGFKGTRLFLKSAQHPEFLKPRVRPFFVLFVILLPWALGTLLLYLSNIPDNPPELLILYAVSFLMVLPMLTNYNATQMQSVRVSLAVSKQRINWVAIICVLLCFILIRAFLFPGVSIN